MPGDHGPLGECYSRIHFYSRTQILWLFGRPLLGNLHFESAMYGVGGCARVLVQRQCIVLLALLPH